MSREYGDVPAPWQPLAIHPVDLPLDTLRGAMAYAVDQEIDLGICWGGDPTYYDDYTTGTIHGVNQFLVYGEGETDVWELPLDAPEIKRVNPTSTHGQRYLAERQSNIEIDPRLFSRLLVSDAEIRRAGTFTMEALLRTFNVPADQIGQSGINLSNVSRSQAGRIVDIMRNQYTDGNWRGAVQLGLATGHMHRFLERARRESYDDPTRHTVTIADDHIGDELLAGYRTDIELLIARALQKGADELQASGRPHAADHVDAWRSLHEQHLTLDAFPPEVTIVDILTRPSYLNPRPDKGVPQILSVGHALNGTEARNCFIRYEDGSVYAVDFPDRIQGARPIRGHEEDGYLGNTNEGLRIGGDSPLITWVDFREAIEHNVPPDLVEEKLQCQSHREMLDAYTATLRTAATFVDEHAPEHLSEEQRAAVKNQLAAVLIAARSLEGAQTNVGSGVSLHDFSKHGYGSKWDIEKETGISLTFGQGLDEVSKAAFEDFGQAINGYELAHLAEAYIGHPEFAVHIAQVRRQRELTEDGTYYYQQMSEAAARLMGQGPVAQLAGEFFGFGGNTAEPFKPLEAGSSGSSIQGEL
ncbi:MAG TPA: hypothetical protein VJP80_02585 [Candidatus Saccharimonadales bacterium]|nr:hypothetical protein [Candidatus Saccharimonadales bacterium]